MSTALSANAFYADKKSGHEVRKRNVEAVGALAKILSTSLGPKGLDKILVDTLGDITITNDGATILKNLEVQHPAARLLVDLSDLQDKEVGDGTTSVVLFAVELLKFGQDCIDAGLHPTHVVQYYKQAAKSAVKYIQSELSQSIDEDDDEILCSIVRTTLMSKLAGPECDSLAKIIVEAVRKVKYEDSLGKVVYPIKAVTILKSQGASLAESALIDGFALSHMSIASPAMPRIVKNAKIAVLAFSLKQYRAPLGVQILISDPEELSKCRETEVRITKERIKKIIDAGANVVFSSEGIDDLSLKYFVEANIMVVRRVPAEELRRIAKVTNAVTVLTMSDSDSEEEVFSASNLGYAGEVGEDRVGDWNFIFIKDCKGGRAASILVRGANEFFTDEIERCVYDGICAVSKALEHKSILPGGGAVEMALNIHLNRLADEYEPKNQYVVKQFASALEVIPKNLALNAGLDSTEIVSKLRYLHYQSENNLDHKHYGLNLITEKIENNFKNGVVEPTLIKIKFIKFATEAAVILLRVDDVLKCAEEK